MNHRNGLLLLFFCAALCLTAACGGTGEDADPAPEGASAAPAGGASVGAAALSSERLPTRDWNDWWEEEGWLPQLVLNTQDAGLLAQAIWYVGDYYGLPEDFDGIENADPEALTRVAIYHTPQIEFQSGFDGEAFASEPDHVVGAFVQRVYAEEGLCIEGPIYYREDVSDTMERLFGEAARPVAGEIPAPSAGEGGSRDALYRYDAGEGLYFMPGNFPTGQRLYPQVVACEWTEDGYLAEAVLVDVRTLAASVDPKEAPEGFEAITPENFADRTRDNLRCRFRFQTAPDDGRFLLDGIETLHTPA